MGEMRETQRVARRIKRLDERREYLYASLNNDPLTESKRDHVKAEWSALDWALRHIERTREAAFEDAHLADVAAGRTITKQWRHVKTGGVYTEVGRAKMQASESPLDDAIVVIYRSNADGKLWVRPAAEFEDGRFEPATPESTGGTDLGTVDYRAAGQPGPDRPADTLNLGARAAP